MIVNVIGGTVADVIMHLPKKYLQRIPGGQKIELPFGSKLLSDEHVLSVGGSGANAAVGLARLGLKTTLVSTIGSDEISEFVKGKLEKENLDLQLDTVKEPSPLSVILSLEGERTIITSHDEHRTYLKKALPEHDHIHLGPISDETSEQYYQKVVSHVVRTDQGVSLNPSMAAIEQAGRAFLALIKIAKITFVNQEEGARLARLTPKTEPKEIVKVLRRMTQGVMCLTCGQHGAYVAQGTNEGGGVSQVAGPIYFAAALDNSGQTVDTTGAGDSFTAAFLASILSQDMGISEEDRLITALKWGIINSASVVATLGAQGGLLSREKVERDLIVVKTKII